MYKNILKGFAGFVGFLASLKVIDYALSLADKNSDTAVLGAVGLILLVILANTFLYRILFTKEKKSAQ